jgi:hypothetical protein
VLYVNWNPENRKGWVNANWADNRNQKWSAPVVRDCSSKRVSSDTLIVNESISSSLLAYAQLRAVVTQAEYKPWWIDTLYLCSDEC